MNDIIYCCIHCGKYLNHCERYLVCNNCSVQFEFREGIPILTENERYWCNIPKDRMRALNVDAANTYWADAVKKYIPNNVAGHIVSESRIDFRYLLPDLKEKRVLDIGSMWGGVTIPISRYAKEVFSIDTTYETLKLLDIRTRQDNISNIKVSLASAHKLPFNDEYFDAIFLIGVLEWLGSDYDFVVSEHYGKRTKNKYTYRNNPYYSQLTALSEIYRVLKPGGVALIAIENRFFYKYFFGWPDDHTLVPFSSLLPRALADIYMRLLKNRRYCEYTYSYAQHEKMLKNIGFQSILFYSAMPSYRNPEVVIPLNDDTCIKFYYENYVLGDLKGLKKIIPQSIIKLNLMKYFVSNFFILAQK